MAQSLNLNASCSTTSQLIGDPVKTPGGSNDGTPALTKILNPAGTATLPVSAALEIQSTLGALVLPRMTPTQIADLDNTQSTVCDGMMVFNTDTKAVSIRTNGAWGISAQSRLVTLNQADIQGLFAGNPAKVLVPAPGAGFAIIVDKVVLVNNFNTTAFANGGAITIGYGVAPAAVIASNALAGTIAANFINIAGPAGAAFQRGANTNNILAGISNLPVSIACATGAFTGGNVNSKVDIYIWYSIIPATT
jgi:hypothetical protein